MKYDLRSVRKDLLYQYVWSLEENGTYKGFLFTGEDFTLKREKYAGIEVEIYLGNGKKEFLIYDERGICIDRDVK